MSTTTATHSIRLRTTDALNTLVAFRLPLSMIYHTFILLDIFALGLCPEHVVLPIKHEN